MGIVRVAKNSNYVVMNRTALNDKRLSWKAKGIMAYLLSMPDDWVFYMEELQTHATDGKASFQSGFKELKDCGYVERKPVREGQRIVRWETIVHEIPYKDSLQPDFQEVEKLQVENQEVGFQEVENQPLLSTDNNQVLNKPNTDINPTTATDPLRFYMDNVRYSLNPIEIETIEHWEREYPKELVIEAMKRSALANATGLRYIENILIDWQKKRITTLAEVERDDAAFEQRKRGRQLNGGIKHNHKPNNGYKADLGF
ncbi:DnaD domain-containing protein [Lysinibacillus sp. LZ02]|uniref:DnaD domain-containing protein n=1 Tax=Lysinibacillus sp. LZ02 TaxID=3420668 RepID=UPI003D3657FE